MCFLSALKTFGRAKGVKMKKSSRLIVVLALLGVLIISGCGEKTPVTPVPTSSGNMTSSSWITEPMQSTQSDLTLELLHVAKSGEDLVFRVKFPLVDWRNWYISKVKLTLEGEGGFTNAQTEFFERLYQKSSGTYCLYQPSYNEIETCIPADSMDTYQIVNLIFSGLPAGFENKQIVLEILEISTGATYCEDLRTPYMEEVLATDFPGLTLECEPGKDAKTYVISEASGFSVDPEAQAAVQALVAEATSGNIAGPWTFEISK
jgi:hypothetical protein